MMQRNLRKALAFLAVPLALSLYAPTGWAAPNASDASPTCEQGHMGPGGKMADRHAMMVQKLGLTPEQSEKVRATMQHGHDESKGLQQQLSSKRHAMMQYLKSPDATESKARDMNAEISDLQKRLGELRVTTWFAMRAQLTPEQIRKLGQLGPPKGMHDGMHGNRSFGGPDGGGFGYHPPMMGADAQGGADENQLRPPRQGPEGQNPEDPAF